MIRSSSFIRRRQSSVISKRMTLATTMMIVAALFLSPGVFSADAITHQHSTQKLSPAGEASPTPSEEETTTTTKAHLLDPALNTDEVRDAAKQVGHIADMDAYLAAIEHKMDVLAEHPAHNVREDIRDIKLGPRGAFVTSRGPPCWRFFSPPLSVVFFQNDASISFCSRAQNRCCSFFYPDRLFTSLVR